MMLGLAFIGFILQNAVRLRTVRVETLLMGVRYVSTKIED